MADLEGCDDLLAPTVLDDDNLRNYSHRSGDGIDSVLEKWFLPINDDHNSDARTFFIEAHPVTHSLILEETEIYARAALNYD